MSLSTAEAANVFLATLDAPADDPTQEVTNELAVRTLPLAEPGTCPRRLREYGPAPKLIVTDEESAPLLARILAETAVCMEPMAAVVSVRLPRLATLLLAGIVNSEAQASGVPNAVVLADAGTNFLLSGVLVSSVKKLDDPVPTATVRPCRPIAMTSPPARPVPKLPLPNRCRASRRFRFPRRDWGAFRTARRRFPTQPNRRQPMIRLNRRRTRTQSPRQWSARSSVMSSNQAAI